MLEAERPRVLLQWAVGS